MMYRSCELVMLVLVLSLLPWLEGHARASPHDAGNQVSGAPMAAKPGDSSGWWRAVQRDLAAREYHLSWQETSYLPDGRSSWQAPNRAHNLRTYFTPAGIVVIPRAPGGASQPQSSVAEERLIAASTAARKDQMLPWQWGLSLIGFGTEAAVAGVADAVLTVDENRIVYERHDLLEWYINDATGLEQGFTVLRPPAGIQSGAQTPRQLVFRLAVSGNLRGRLNSRLDRVEFHTSGGVDVLMFGKLVAVDANGVDLSTRFALRQINGSQVLELQIAAASATYPIIVDPLATGASWSLESNQAGAQLGYSVASAGDVNGDGFDDVIVGANRYDNGEAGEGRAFVFHGGPAGLGPIAAWHTESNQPGAGLGIAVASAGDVNNDGFDDVIVGAAAFSNGEDSEGSAFAFHGSPTGLSDVASWSAESDQETANFGGAVASAGDVNHDGYADVVVGARFFDNGEESEGRAFVYHGGPTGLSAVADWNDEADQIGARFGTAVASAGDVNDDGYADVIISASGFDNGEDDEGGAFVYLGSAAGLGSSPEWTAESNQAFSLFGISVGSAGDVNDDGFDDVIVGASQFDNGENEEGAAFVYHGSAVGLSLVSNWSAELDQAFAFFGRSVAAAGDVDGDGFGDVVVGARGYSNGEAGEGGIFIYRGTAAGLATTAAWNAESDLADARLGFSVAAAGDVNADGYADVIAGAVFYSNDQADEGRAFVYYGSLTGLMPAFDWAVESSQTAASLGYSVSSAGDVNGDGFSDVIVGAREYDNGANDEGAAFVYHGRSGGPGTTANWSAESNQANALFGGSVASAGDVNGDGYADVIVGAGSYSFNQSNEGRAFVYHGSAAGLSTAFDWSAESNQENARFGAAVSSAGDINGDGFSEVLIGAPDYEDGESSEGGAFVYLGSAAGLSATVDWSAEGDQFGGIFGESVAAAGDVNGDGFADVIVGAPFYNNGESNEGTAFVYHGNAGGLSAVADWTAESNQVAGELGCSVSSAGDVNGDGYGDVIVGAKRFTNGQDNEGRAYVYLGSASGLGLAASWTAESDQIDALFGFSVASAGDVNGDGFADVIVGALEYDNGQTDEGAAFVYLGSSTGLHTDPSRMLEGNQMGSRFGRSVAAAGDLNGDGYSDVIVGAPLYDNPELAEGAAFVYYGAADGLAQSPGFDVEGNQTEAVLGTSVAGAGDVNGDGYSDVIVGAPGFDNGQIDEGQAYVYHGSATGPSTFAAWRVDSDQVGAQFGFAVSGAGDVNGDGFSDVVVGAPFYDNGEQDEGGAFVYLGSAAGLSSAPVWDSESDQADALFGLGVSSAGDVNGDGYGDVIVGAPLYDDGENSEGAAFVYYGGAAGLAAAPDWDVESDQADAFMGVSVSSAGDVNGDGYSDVIVSAPLYDNGENDEGRAYVYLGGASGLDVAPAWQSEVDSAGAFYGSSVASAGDVNGDGYADVVVGAQFFSNGETLEGRAYVYHGDADGLSAVENWFAESNGDFFILGGSVSSAGDVNGDGYDDVVVGVSDYSNGEVLEGAAYLYHGGVFGLDPEPAWIGEPNVITTRFGAAVAAAGDVNGDGFGDFIVGAPDFDSPAANEGAAFIYFGNDGSTLSQVPRQQTSDGSAPIARLGLSDSYDSFGLALEARTYLGRALVKLEWEVKPAGVPFDGTGLQQSNAWVDTGLAGASIAETVDGLSGGMLYKWRMRVRHHPAQAPAQPGGRWFTLAANGLALPDLRTPMAPDLDGDGLSDSLEMAGCTSATDADSDDDGLPDGDEDANANGVVDPGETDPCNADSDGDGIQDGTELGLTAGVSDPDGGGPLLGTDGGAFIADADAGATVTDPLAFDTDGDGFIDGDEDLNADGQVDGDETDPLDPLSFPVTGTRQIPLPLWALLILVLSIAGLGCWRTRKRS